MSRTFIQISPFKTKFCLSLEVPSPVHIKLTHVSFPFEISRICAVVILFSVNCFVCQQLGSSETFQITQNLHAKLD